jgi:5-hydroxyisourate hydrolase
MSAITTHVLDTAAGRPGAGIRVELSLSSGGNWEVLGHAVTDSDGRARSLLAGGHILAAGLYRLRFETRPLSAFFPEVTICFEVRDPNQHYHVPLLLSPYGYSTYRGS